MVVVVDGKPGGSGMEEGLDLMGVVGVEARSRTHFGGGGGGVGGAVLARDMIMGYGVGELITVEVEF